MPRRLTAVAASVVSDALRRKVVYVVLFFAALMALVIPQLPSYGVGVAAAVFREVALALTYTVTLVLSLLLSVTRIPSEIERRTVYPVLARPMSRWEYLAGSWLGVVTVLFGSVAAFNLVNQAVAFLSYGDPMWRLWEGALAVWFEMSVLAAFAMAVSTRLGAVTSAMATLVFAFAAHSRSALLGSSGPVLVRALYPSLDTFDLVNPVAHGNGVGAGYLLVMVAVFAAWSGMLLLAGSALLSTRDV